MIKSLSFKTVFGWITVNEINIHGKIDQSEDLDICMNCGCDASISPVYEREVVGTKYCSVYLCSDCYCPK